MSVVGSSLQEARELYELLQRCDTKFKDVKREVRESKPSITETLNLLYQMLDTLDRFGMGSNLEAVLLNFRRILHMINMVRVAWMILQMTTPFGMVMGALGMVTSAVAYVAAEGYMRT